MPQTRPWFRVLLGKLKRSENPDKHLEQMARNSPNTENVFDLGVSARELQAAVKAMRKDLRELHVQIKNHLERYQKYLQAADEASGITATDHKLDAQDQLEDAQDKHNEYDALASKYQVLRRALKKWERIQRRRERQREYNVDVGDLNLDKARQRIEELEEADQIEQQNADRLRSQLDMLGRTAEPDFEDVDKDLEELEKDRLTESTSDDWDLTTVETESDHQEEDLPESLHSDDPLTMEDLDEMT